MDEVEELIRKYGLDEDPEHVIIPFRAEDGSMRRCFLLKRRFFRIVFADGHFHDYPLEEVIEASVLHPFMPLRESILLVHKEAEALEAEETMNSRGEGEEKNTD
jgi:hypothetical protein